MFFFNLFLIDWRKNAAESTQAKALDEKVSAKNGKSSALKKSLRGDEKIRSLRWDELDEMAWDE